MTNRLKELRKEKGLTQKELASELSIPLRTLQSWENGERKIKPDKAQALADYFDVSVGYLLGYEHEEGTATEAQLVFGKMLVDIIGEIEMSAWICGQVQTLFVNGHEYKVTVEKVGAGS